MNNVASYFEQAELAFAAYFNLSPGMAIDDYELALRDDGDGMTPTQAAAFASRWEVIDQYTHSHSEVLPTYDDAGNLTGYATLTTSNGLSVTVFKDKVTGKRHVAIRGTEFTDIGDLTADGGILLHGIPELSEQYQALKSKIEAWQSNGTLTGTFTVTGHSLGGWLAGGLAQDFAGSVEHTYLYNTPGVEGALDGILQQLNEALGTSFASAPSLANLTNIRASTGISPIAGLGLPLSQPIGIHIEDQKLFDALLPGGADTPLSLNHSQRVLTDSLALYALFARIDPDVSVESISKIIKAASAKNGNTLETTLDALRTLFQQNYQYGHLDYDAVPTLDSGTAASRDDFYTKLHSLTAWWEASPFTALTIEPLSTLGREQIVARAKLDTAEGQAYRYALYKLNPFAVTGSSVLYDGINAHDELDLYDPASGTGALTEFSHVVFGSENNDVLTGWGKADRLYGGVANEAVWKEAA